MKKPLSKIMVLLLIFCLCLSFAACGKSSNENTYDESYDTGYGSPESMPETYQESTKNEENSSVNTDVNAELNPNAAEGRKIIYTSSLNVESTKFDESYQKIMDCVKEYGAYVSYSSTNGGYYSSNSYYVSKKASMTIRVPADNYEAFMAAKGDFGNITYSSESAEDITLSYVDTEAKLSSLNAQQERLLKLIDKANTVEELVLLENSLNDVRYQIESATSVLKTYDDLISYCTVDITLSEVNSVSSVNTGFWAQVWNAIKDSWVVLLNALQRLVILLIYLLPFALIALVIAFIVIKSVRKRRAKRGDAMKFYAQPKKAEEVGEGKKAENKKGNKEQL